MNLGYLKRIIIQSNILDILKFKNYEVFNDSLNHDEIVNMIYKYILLVFN